MDALKAARTHKFTGLLQHGQTHYNLETDPSRGQPHLV